jgi:hypothetical protein
VPPFAYRIDFRIFHQFTLLISFIGLCSGFAAQAGTLLGHVRDQNWYARPSTSDPWGVGYYEFAVNANGSNIVTLGGLDDTDVFGSYAMSNLVAGSYTVASWDVWWRSAFKFNVNVPLGTTADIDLRLNATMWGYAAFWDENPATELGQTFVATGPVTMMYLRLPDSSGSFTLTVHTNGPGGAQIGQSRSFGVGDQRPIWGYGQMPTIAGGTYYVRIRASTGRTANEFDPRPDFSDPMPGGCLWRGPAGAVVPYPDRDLGITIMSDDDGLITDMFTRPTGGTNWSGVTSVGQTFIARGANLISAAFWLPDGTLPTYALRVLQNGPGGGTIGPIKRNKPARPGADPEVVVTWGPGEVPLTSGQTYYLEITKDGGGVFNSVYINTGNVFAFGDAYRDGVIFQGIDLAGTIMEEESNGSATRPQVALIADPFPSNRGTNSLTITWTTDVPADSKVEFAVETPPYTGELISTQLVTSHSLTVTGLQSHTLYHYRASSSRTDYRPAVSRDFVICTRPTGNNLLLNPGFEEGAGASPRSTVLGWTKSSGLDIRTSDGSWFWSLKPTNGLWLLEGAVNGSTSDGYIFQRVSNAIPGSDYTFSAWLMTAMRENNNWKYDVWNTDQRLIYMRLGIDPTGGTNINSSTVQWTPRMYSHRHYTQLAKSAVAQSSNVTVFVHMKGTGGEWHTYAVDDCALTHEEIPTRFDSTSLSGNRIFQSTLFSRANRTNRVESTSTLENSNTWTTVTNMLNRSGTIPFTYPAPSNSPPRFFRARTL